MYSIKKHSILFIGLFLMFSFQACTSVKSAATSSNGESVIEKKTVRQNQEQKDAPPEGIHPSKSPKTNPNSQSQLQPSGILQDK